MDAQETRGIERLLEARYGLLLQALLSFGGERDVIVLRLYVVQLGDRNDVYVAAVAEHDTIRMLTRRARCAGEFGRNLLLRPHALASAGESSLETFRAEGLQQVIDRVDLEGSQSVLIVSSDEDDGELVPDKFQDLKTVKLRHLDVEEDKVGLALVDRL